MPLLITNPKRSASRPESEYQMTVEEFIESMQVKVNIMHEQKAERERYERGVIAMREASNRESQ